VDAVITDPPYNVGKDYGTHNDKMNSDEYMEWARQCVELSRSRADNQFWVAPRYKMELWLSLLPGAHIIVIPRGASGPLRQGWVDQFETALCIGNPIKHVSDLWTGIRLKGEGYFFTEETWGHPGYTPYLIMARAILLLTATTVIDPFCGTGTTLRAAKDRQRKAIGIEIEEKYCEITAERLQQEVLGM
jgi:site-specific DNA-methyltransferase (adenine-specific)